MNDTRPDVRSHLVKNQNQKKKNNLDNQTRIIIRLGHRDLDFVFVRIGFFVNQKVKKLAAKTNFFLDRWKQNLG